MFDPLQPESGPHPAQGHAPGGSGDDNPGKAAGTGRGSESAAGGLGAGGFSAPPAVTEIKVGFVGDPGSQDDRRELTGLEQQLHHALCA